MEDKNWRAILAKNEIARELRDYRAGERINLPYILSCLEDIEAYTGESNQPSVQEIINSQYRV